MKKKYKITLQDQHDDSKVVMFDFAGHDDIFSIIDNTRNQYDLAGDNHLAFILGLKLLGEVAMDKRKTPLFKAFFPHLKAFITHVKTYKPERPE